MKRVTCSSCHKYRDHFERGLCRMCWDRRRTCAGPRGVPVPCAHCLVGQGWTKLKKLCEDCSEDATIWRLYGGKDGLVESDRVKDSVLPASATATDPGSEENLKVLAGRYQRGESLHHPDDCKVPYAPPSMRLFVGGERLG